MNCCSRGDPAARADRAPSPTSSPSGWAAFKRSAAALVQWAVPLSLLALVPKCPACVAGYVLLFTGVGLSFTVASALRLGVIAASVAAVTFLAVRAARRLITSRWHASPR